VRAGGSYLMVQGAAGTRELPYVLLPRIPALREPAYLVTWADTASHFPFRRAQTSV
jgi:hypothetical protein